MLAPGLAQGFIDLKLCKGSVDKVLEDGSYKQFYMHRTGHWLGLDVHDAGDYMRKGKWRKLKPGMVLTVEPGCYIRPADNVPKAFWNIGVRIEDDVLVTAQGPRDPHRRLPEEREGRRGRGPRPLMAELDVAIVGAGPVGRDARGARWRRRGSTSRSSRRARRRRATCARSRSRTAAASASRRRGGWPAAGATPITSIHVSQRGGPGRTVHRGRASRGSRRSATRWSYAALEAALRRAGSTRSACP